NFCTSSSSGQPRAKPKPANGSRAAVSMLALSAARSDRCRLKAMPDVIVIGGGVIGATAAWQLAEQGAEVLLLERGVLAGGSTGRSQGLLLPPDHQALVPLFEESNALYRSLADHTELDLGLDDEPIGTLLLATDETQLADLSGLDIGTLLDDAETMAEEPA